MKFASSFVVCLFFIVDFSAALVDSQHVSPRGQENRVRGGSSATIVAEFDSRIDSQAKGRRLKGEKEIVSDEVEKAEKEEKGVEKADKEETGEEKMVVEKVDKGDDKRAKKEKPTEEEISVKESIKETDKLVKEASSTVSPMVEESSAPDSAPGVAAEATNSPAPTVSPTCVECDDFGR